MTTAQAKPVDLDAHRKQQRAKIEHAQARARRDLIARRIVETGAYGGNVTGLRGMLDQQDKEVTRLAAALPGAKQ